MKHGGGFDANSIREEIDQLEVESGTQEFWSDRGNAERVLGRLKQLKGRIEPWESMMREIEELGSLCDLAIDENEPTLEGDIEATLLDISARYKSESTRELLSDIYDGSDAFVTIHSGAGGKEACDWVNMLYRMYSRWMERKSFRAEILDLLEVEGGLKSITFMTKGDYAYGLMKGETGVHRLVRISPFDSGARRHTSFASVYISPVVEEDIELDIAPEDIRIDTYRAQGAGGQHVNKTDSAVRITHLSTGIVVQCQNDRSQHKNKASAMKVLRSRLYDHYKRERELEQQQYLSDKSGISWGNQIRSYVFQPYTMVKDHRTRWEAGNIQGVIDGDLDPFIEEYLRWEWIQKER